MLLEVHKNTESGNPKVIKAKNGIIMVLLDSAVFGSKTIRFSKYQ